jgi:HlyD family secretion protein
MEIDPMKQSIHLLALAVLSIFYSCNKDENQYDASGSFEAVETIISSEANGKILSFNINEGDNLKANDIVGSIDSSQLLLSREQIAGSRKAILSGRPEIKTQLDALEKELENAIRDRDRIANLVKGNVASQKQLDDAEARVATTQAKIEAQKSSLLTSTNSINNQGNSVEAQLNLIEDQIRKCKIVNPIDGTVLTKYAEVNEMTSIGRPLYKIANLQTMILRVYISGNQLSKAKLSQNVKVFVDNGEGGYKEMQGTIIWISSKAEFTPKTIQTKDERANMVYAVKVTVKNDGSLKIGMYGEIKF